MKKYWFRPKRFWNWFAAYYPVSWEGWVCTLAAIWLFVYAFAAADKQYSGWATLFAFAPKGILILLAWDILARVSGEYPSWWKKHFWNKK